MEQLWRRADRVRREYVGDAVYLRGLLEISNHCVRRCHYCGIRADNHQIERYRLTTGEILEGVRQAQALGIGTVVLQSGEDPELTTEWIADLIVQIRRRYDLAITLSLGERGYDELAYWKQLGADRYLLRFETSNAELFARIHPAAAGRVQDRIIILHQLRELGYEVGSGVMVGIPGQGYEDLIEDLLLFEKLDLDMIGIGPFIAHPDTPLGKISWEASDPAQVPADELMTLKMVALARLVCPQANIPSTTALATIDPQQGRELGLQRGANIIMPNLTPPDYRRKYEIYPGKACLHEEAISCHCCLERRIINTQRTLGRGPGCSPNWQRRRERLSTT